MIEVKLGAATATRIEESYEPNFEAKTFFPDWNPDVVREHGSWMSPNHYDAASGWLKLSIHSWLLKIGGKTILIDTCVGNHKSRRHRPKWDMMTTPYLDRLKAAGVTPDQIDMVMCTHLHVDHVGWNTRLDTDPQKGPANGGSFRDSVLPVVEAGLVQMVTGASQLDENLRITPAPGHTPGTIRIEFESKGEKALFCGDILHHALQVYHPEWNSFACLDQDNARKSRRAAIEHCAGSGALLMPCHFGAPFHCHIDHKGSGFAPRFAANF
jgi:glyoxylase-like metal-dependent hydrolase (beta-lactamase superfamily II)